MNRRSFLRGVLGVSAAAALPLPALEFIAKNHALTDEVFRRQAIIDLLEIRMASATEMMRRALDDQFYSEGTCSTWNIPVSPYTE